MGPAGLGLRFRSAACGKRPAIVFHLISVMSLPVREVENSIRGIKQKSHESSLLSMALMVALAPVVQAAEDVAEGAPSAGTDIVNLDTLIVTAIAPSAAMTLVTDPKFPRQPVAASDDADCSGCCFSGSQSAPGIAG